MLELKTIVRDMDPLSIFVHDTDMDSYYFIALHHFDDYFSMLQKDVRDRVRGKLYECESVLVDLDEAKVYTRKNVRQGSVDWTLHAVNDEGDDAFLQKALDAVTTLENEILDNQDNLI